jgi:hypothetical protein
VEVEYEDRLVAFIDILGFKELVKQSISSYEAMNKIYYAMQTILNVKTIEEHFYSSEIVRPYQATVTTFSDSIVISYLVGLHGSLFRILLDIIHLQLELAYQGILIRGGITIGKAYHDGQIIYGPAMNDAYSLESASAIYPRIIVDQSTLITGIQLTHDECHSEKEEAEYINALVKKDKDGFWYLDFLRQYGELDYP